MASAVLDANLLVVVVAGDPRGDRVAEQLLEWRSQAIELHAPHLLTYEVARALTLLVSSGALPADAVDDVWTELRAIPISLHPLSDVPRVVVVARELRRASAYDAAYLALAQELDTTLWTLDARLQRNATAAGFDVRLV